MDDILIYIKLHKTENGTIIAMCDEKLIGKVVSEGDVEIDIDLYADFYRGELIDAADTPLLDEIDNMSSANIIGEEAVNAAVKSLIINRDSVKIVDGVPFAQSFRIKS